jgi:lipid-A-disaccharide synthase
MTTRMAGDPASLSVFVIAGEESGDQLGAKLMEALRHKLGEGVDIQGVGGPRMINLGLESLFPMEEISLHGLTRIVPRIPALISRIGTTANIIAAARPHVLELIDVPGFNLRIGNADRRRQPSIPIVDYVSPTVWAYAPWRARSMARFVDLLLAILPFEPAVHRRLGGPLCEYVGHPLIEMGDRLRPSSGERPDLDGHNVPNLLILSGSRRSEIDRLLGPFGEALDLIAKQTGPLHAILPTMEHLADAVRAGIKNWAIQPQIIVGEAEKFAAFRRAHAALAASGTVSLELALAGVPMVIAYKLDPLVRWLTPFMRAKSIVLANLVLEDNVVPEFLDGRATPARLAAETVPLLSRTPARAKQVLAFEELDARMALPSGTPSGLAADLVIKTATAGRQLLAP